MDFPTVCNEQEWCGRESSTDWAVYRLQARIQCSQPYHFCCLCMCIFTCSCMCVHLYELACGDQKLQQSAVLDHFLSYSLRQVLHKPWAHCFADAGWLVRFRGLPVSISLFVVFRIWNTHIIFGRKYSLLVGMQDDLLAPGWDTNLTLDHPPSGAETGCLCGKSGPGCRALILEGKQITSG